MRRAADGTTLVPGVTEGRQVSPDGRHHTFNLRAGARWSNGDPVTAADFLAGILRLLDPAMACESVNNAFLTAGARDCAEDRNPDPASVGLRAPEPRAFVISLVNRTPFLLALPAGVEFRLVHRSTLEKFGGLHRRDTPWTQPGNLVGGGPFVLTEWRANEVIVVAKNALYRDAGRVRLREIRL